MGNTFNGVPWDVSYEPQSGDDLIMLDAPEGVVYLSKEDLLEMLENLNEGTMP